MRQCSRILQLLVRMSPASVKFGFLMVAMCLLSCGPQVAPKPRNVQELLPAGGFDLDLPESVMLQGQGLSMDENFLYFSVAETGRIKQYTRAGEDVRVYGSKGQGPGEFHHVNQLTARDGLLFALDYGLFINVFDDQGKFVDKINLPTPVTGNRIAVDAKMQVYIATPQLSKPISVYDMHGSLLQGFGEWLEYRPEKTQREADNSRHLFFNSAGNLVSISMTLGNIEIYSPEGIRLSHKVMRYDSRFRAHFAEVAQGFAEEPKAANRRVYILVRDAELIDDKLLFLHYGSQDNQSANLMIVDVKGEKIGKGTDYVLRGKNGGNITSFMITGRENGLYVYESAVNWIYFYKLPPALFSQKDPG